jgi:Ca2+-binding EF-hand superfamily protein
MTKRLFIAVLVAGMIFSAGSVLYGQAGTSPAPKNPMVDTIFKEADANADGFIAWEEAQKASAQYKRELYSKPVFDEYDESRDGKLSREEVNKYVDDTQPKTGTEGGF